MFLHYKLSAGLNVKFGPRYRGNCQNNLNQKKKNYNPETKQWPIIKWLSTKTSTVNMTECSSYYQKVYPRVSLLVELKRTKKGSLQNITVNNFSNRCPCPIRLYLNCIGNACGERIPEECKAFVEGGRWLYGISISRSIPTYFRASA